MAGHPAEFASFEDFYERQIEQLTRALTVSLGSPQFAQDAAQEAMARAYQRWTKIQRYQNPTGWCYRVAMNWATSRWRRRRRESLTDTFDSATAVESIGEDNSHVLAALRRLPDDQRDVLVLRLIEDWSISETAVALGVPEGTVQSRYSRALQRMRALLADEDR